MVLLSSTVKPGQERGTLAEEGGEVELLNRRGHRDMDPSRWTLGSGPKQSCGFLQGGGGTRSEGLSRPSHISSVSWSSGEYEGQHHKDAFVLFKSFLNQANCPRTGLLFLPKGAESLVPRWRPHGLWQGFFSQWHLVPPGKRPTGHPPDATDTRIHQLGPPVMALVVGAFSDVPQQGPPGWSVVMTSSESASASFGIGLAVARLWGGPSCCLLRPPLIDTDQLWNHPGASQTPSKLGCFGSLWPKIGFERPQESWFPSQASTEVLLSPG